MSRNPPLANWLHALSTRLVGPGPPLVAATLLALVLGWQIAGLAWRLAPDAPPAHPPSIQLDEPDVIEAGARPGEAARRLARLSVFGEMPEEDEETVADRLADGPEDAPETQLDLDLRGLYAVGDGDGFAIIVAGDAGEQVFGVGDSITGNARVAGIYGDRVLLRRDGSLEALWLDDAEAREQAQRGAGNQGQNSRQEIDAIASTARNLRAELLNNPQNLNHLVRFQPYQRGGELIGFRLRPRQGHERTLQALGLTPNDVLTEINGIPLNDRRRGQQALDELRDAREVRVRFLRDSQPREITLPLGDPTR